MSADGDWLEEIDARAAKATRGPWRWAEEEFRDRYAQRSRTGRWRARPGKTLRQTWVMLLVGPVRGLVHPEHADEWDYPHVLALRWHQIKGDTLMGATPSPGDRAFIAHARQDVPRLVAEVRRLRALLDPERRAEVAG